MKGKAIGETLKVNTSLLRFLHNNNIMMKESNRRH